MGKEVLVTEGEGFVRSHLADYLLDRGYKFVILDNLSEQVQGKTATRPAYLNPEADLCLGDVRDREAVRSALQNADIVFHFSARVRMGQSMYDIRDYTDVNNVGTSVILEEIVRRSVEKQVAGLKAVITY